MRRVPPAPSRQLPREELQDLLHDVVYHCARDDFRVLRLYQDQGQNFAAWFHVVAYHQALLYLRKRGHVGHRKHETPRKTAQASAPQVQVLDKVWRALSAMDAYCRQLLLLAAEEYTPRDVVRAWGLPEGDNKKVGDQIRDCRRKLKAALEGSGVDWRSGLAE
jgi:DNA-directed RNA polymerase specialized sigma24 family protein